MSYILNYSGGTITIPLGTADTSSTPLTIIGRNWTSPNVQQGYGQALNQNFISILENFASPTAPTMPLQGQFWFDTSSATVKLNTGTPAAPVWVAMYAAGAGITSVANGTSSVDIPTLNGDINISVGTIANVLTVTTAGADLLGDFTATGSVTTANITTGTNTTPGTITGDWTLTTGSKLSATYADLAEYYTIDTHAEAGTVVEFGGTHEIRLCDTDASTRVAGVISEEPAFVMNAAFVNNLDAQAVALQGRVPCRVVGVVHKGDMMVSAGAGCARSESNPVMGSVIGKSLEDKFTPEMGIIEVVVGRL